VIREEGRWKMEVANRWTIMRTDDVRFELRLFEDNSLTGSESSLLSPQVNRKLRAVQGN
jgi:hypothetical protein